MNVNSISLNASQTALVPAGQKGKSRNDVLPSDLIPKILEYLSLSEGCNTARVCSLWNRVVQKLPDFTLSVFGAKEWEHHYGLKVEEGGPPLPKKICQTTHSDRRRLAGKKEAPSCTAILMPKGLSLNKLNELVENPINGNSTKLFEYICPRAVDEFWDEPVKESYWFVITKDVIEGSRSKRYAEQKALVEQKTGFECELPKILEVVVCCVMHHVSSKEYLFGRNPWTFTSCQEQIDDCPWCVGGFASNGLIVGSSFDADAAASRRFC